MKSKRNRIHIIAILGFSPKYEYEEDENKIIATSIHYWRNKKGELIGVWKEDSMHHRGFFFLECYPDIIWEAWRPDIRADKVYEHTFENGFIHKSFPVSYIKTWNGIRRKKEIYSPLMEDCLNNYIKKKTNEQLLLVLPTSHKSITYLIQKNFSKIIPILNVRFINNEPLLGKYAFKINPVRFLHDYLKAVQIKRYMNQIDNLLLTHSKYSNEIENKYDCRVFINPHFEDVGFWCRDISKEEARMKLAIPYDKKVIFSSSRLVPEYQIDKIIDVLGRLGYKDFLFYISGNGDKEYIRMINKKIDKYRLNNNVVFTGYIMGDELKAYYIASDVYVSTCIRQACPKSTNKAILLEVPVIATDTGFGVELLKEYNGGLIIPQKYSFNKWKKAFQSVFAGDEINTPQRDEIVSIFEKENIGKKWMEIFREIVEN